MRSADGSGATVGGSGVPDRRGPLRYGVGELGSSGPEEDELLYLRDRMRRPRFRTSPSTNPPSARRGRGLTELHSLKDDPNTSEASPQTDNAEAAIRISRPTQLTRHHCISP